MAFFGRKPSSGRWWFYSKTDSRWNAQGETSMFLGYQMPAEADAKLAKLRKQYGNPPSDLEQGCYEYD